MAIIIQRACVIAFAGLVAGGVHSALHPPIKLRPDAPPPLPPARTTTGDAAPTTTPAQVLGLDITTPQAWDLFQQGAAFADARRRDEYEAGHVQGAFFLPSDLFYEAKGGLPEALNYIAKDQVIVIYCGGGACDASHNTAKLLQQAGYLHTHVMKDGYPSWVAAGHPTASGAPDYETGAASPGGGQ